MKLTDRQLRILKLLLAGLTDRQMAFAESTSLSVIQNAVSFLLFKYGVVNRVQLVLVATKHLPLDEEERETYQTRVITKIYAKQP